MKILGAGIAGLTAAINLALEGYDVEVYEKRPEIGMQMKETPKCYPIGLQKNTIL